MSKTVRRIRISLAARNGLIVWGAGDFYEAVEIAEKQWAQDVHPGSVPRAVNISRETGKETDTHPRWDLSEELANVQIPDALIKKMEKVIAVATDASMDDACRQWVRPVVDIDSVVDYAFEKAGLDMDEISEWIEEG